MKSMHSLYESSQQLDEVNIDKPAKHLKELTNMIIDMANVSNRISDFLEFIKYDDLNTKWLRMTGDVMIGMNDLKDFIKQKVPTGVK